MKENKEFEVSCKDIGVCDELLSSKETEIVTDTLIKVLNEEKRKHKEEMEALLESKRELERKLNAVLHDDDNGGNVIYGFLWSKDCDGYLDTTMKQFNSWSKFLRWQDDEYEKAEGLVRIWSGTKEEWQWYLDNPPSSY
tara:strand:- start:1478 stop:1894 length:417 start_codon:yes stop_codon:yes gene_type:complete